MFYNYLKTALRNLLRNKLFTTLNLLGLSTGMACSILIFLWVQDEKNFDTFNPQADHLYRVTAKVADVDAAVVPNALPVALQTEIPGVVSATRVNATHRMVSVGSQKFDEKRMYFADSNFLRMFNYPLLEGDKNTLLLGPNSIVLTAATASKYFGSTDVIGKTVHLDDINQDFTVTGVLKNVPANSHLQFDILLPIIQYDRMQGQDLGDQWNNYDSYTYFQAADNSSTSLQRIEHAMNVIRKKSDVHDLNATLYTQPLRDIHLYSNFLLDVDGQGNGRTVNIFSLVAMFIIFIACINFMNLATALSGQRAKEVGLRKTIGAHRSQLFLQFISESFLITFASFILGIALALLLLPLFNGLTGKALTANMLSLRMLASLFGLLVLVGLLAGSYPALYLSSFRPVQVLKGVKVLHSRKNFFRNGLVVAQFSISLILMISTIVVYKQLQFIRNRDIGYQKEDLVYMPLPDVGNRGQKKDALEAELSRTAGIGDYTFTDNLPTDLNSGGKLMWRGMPQNSQVICFRLRTDDHFIQTFGVKLLAGRFFNRAYHDTGYVVNEAMLKVMHVKLSDAIGKLVSPNENEGPIIGVVKDFNFRSVQQPIAPLFFQDQYFGGYLVVRAPHNNIDKSVAQVKNIFANVFHDYPFSYGFVNQDIDKLYTTEQRMGSLFNLFSILSVIISCLGLFGLATFATQRRIKEIGVRKVLGASEPHIVAMLSKDFLQLVVLAMLIAFPAAAWLMEHWLQGFAYRINLYWWFFALAGATAVLVALLTVSYQSVKAAMANPVQSLKSD
jgi:putative ABC transport system permease protein